MQQFAASGLLPCDLQTVYNRRFSGKSVKWADISSPFFLLDRLRIVRDKRAAEAALDGSPRRLGRLTGSKGGTSLIENAVVENDIQSTQGKHDVATSGAGWRSTVATTVAALNYELVDVERGLRGLLRVYIDRVPGHAYPQRHGSDGALDASEFVTVDDCEQVTRQLQYALEVDGLDYARLEVSSPGLDRPLKTEAHFERFSGLEVSVTLKSPFQGRKVWKGILGHASEGKWQLVFHERNSEQAFGFGFDEVREASLVPVVDFKGRKSRSSAQSGAHDGVGQSDQAGPAQLNATAPGADGGRD